MQDKRSKTGNKRQGSNPEFEGLGKMMPSNAESEELVLGVLLAGLEKSYTISHILPEAAFYKEQNRIIYGAILKLVDENQPVDVVTVLNHVKKRGELELIGGAFYLMSLTNKAISSASLINAALSIKEAYVLREIITKTHELQARCYDETTDFFESISDLEKITAEVTQMVVVGKAETAANLFNSVMEENKKIAESNGITGVPSGFADIDKMIGGFQKADLIILAARPSMGKTALALSMFKNATMQGYEGLFFSIEMSNNKLYARIMSQVSGVPLSSIIMRGLADYEYRQILAKEYDLKSPNMFFDDTPSIRLADLKAKARKLYREKKIKFIMVDYLQLIENKRQGINREQEVSEISRGLKSLAKELDIPIIALAQLSRANEKRGTGHRPMLSDLRESGSMEADADVVGFIHRPEYYGITEDEKGDSTIGISELIIAKNRNGPTGTIRMKFVKENTAFEDLNKIEQPTASKLSHYQDIEKSDFDIKTDSPF